MVGGLGPKVLSVTSFSVDGQRFEVSECRLDSDEDIDLADAARVLSVTERERADAFVFSKDRDRFVRARGFLRAKLGGYLGQDPKDVEIAEHPGGKPYISGDRVKFNISHSGGYLVVVLTTGHDVGIDLEVQGQDSALGAELRDLAASCLTESEQSELFRTPISDRTRRFLTYWTAKEARMKVHGEGFGLEPKKVALQLDDGFPVGYLRPEAENLKLRYVELCTPASVCCVAFGP